MLRKILSALTPVSPGRPEKPAASMPPPRQQTRPGTPLYPPIDQGIEACDAAAILASQEQLIRRIRLLSGTSDQEFVANYLSVIDRLAKNILLLPASEADTHSGPGGLFRLSLELAFFSAQAAEGVVFSGRASAEDRRREEPRWRYAAFLSGLCCELHRSVAGMTVVTSSGAVWPAFSMPLSQWLEEAREDRFFVRWVPNTNGQATASLLVSRIVPPASLQYLQDGSPRIVPTMMDVIAGVQNGPERHTLSVIIETIREKVIARDKGVRPTSYGKLTVGAHLEPHLLDAMRQLVNTGEWKINEKRARLWYSQEGLFLVWRTAAKEMLGVLEKDAVRGVPQDAQTLLDILVKANVFVSDRDGSPYWMIMPPTSSGELVAVRFSDPMVVFGAMLENVEPVASLTQPPPSAGAHAPAEKPAATTITGTPASTTPKDQQSRESGSETSTSQPPATSGGAAIPEAQQEDEGVRMPGPIANLLSPATRQVMNTILAEHLAGQLRGHAGVVPEGFAISIERLTEYGVPLESLTTNLQKSGWLYAPPEKPGKKLHQVKLNNKPLQAIVIKMAQARDAGFTQ